MVLAPVVVMGTRSGIGPSLWQEEAEKMKVVKIIKSSCDNVFFIFLLFFYFTNLMNIYILLTVDSLRKFDFFNAL